MGGEETTDLPNDEDDHMETDFFICVETGQIFGTTRTWTDDFWTGFTGEFTLPSSLIINLQFVLTAGGVHIVLYTTRRAAASGDRTSTASA